MVVYNVKTCIPSFKHVNQSAEMNVVTFYVTTVCLSCALLICSNGELTRENEEWRKRYEHKKRTQLTCHVSGVSLKMSRKFLSRFLKIVFLCVTAHSKKLWKHSPAARVPTAFLVLSNFHSCFYDSIETRHMFSIS